MEHFSFKYKNFDIKLPSGLECVLDTPVRDSYQEFLKHGERDVRRHLTAACTLIPDAVWKYQPAIVLHPFGGVGATAQIIDQSAENPNMIQHELWDRDPVLVKYLKDQMYNARQVEDSFQTIQLIPEGEYDMIIFDMSVGTIKTPGVKDFWEHVADWGIPIWFTDTSCHKIHLNYRSYGKDFGEDIEPTAESYLRAYSRWLNKRGYVISAAMREAGEFYCMAEPVGRAKEFQAIPYL